MKISAEQLEAAQLGEFFPPAVTDDVDQQAGGGVSSEQKVKNPRYPGAFSSDQPTPFEKRAEEFSSIIEPDSGDKMFGQRAPHYPILHEQAQHRVICWLKAEGNTNMEIARKTGYSSVAISNIVRQPWAVVQIAQMMKECGKELVTAALKGAALAAVERLITECDSEKAKPSERITAANSLLDRLYGKPNQPLSVKTEDENFDPNTLSDAELTAKIKDLEATVGQRNS